ncbi:MAG: S-methyl-5-thioribose-1-phosphate isomerase [Candidatus Omnitrophota bacterium]
MLKIIYWKKGKLVFIDQSILPNKLCYIHCGDIYTLYRAIKALKIRGAPLLGVAGAYGVVLGLKNSKAKNYSELARQINKIIKYLGSSRPTAVNLFWALERMAKCAKENSKFPPRTIFELLLNEAHEIMEEDIRSCRKIGENTQAVLKNNDAVLTHCNAGALATSLYGTALSGVYVAKETGKKIKVYADETRPILQGSRLTAWELQQNGIDVTLICDNMAASLMKKGMIDKVIVGADRIAANGDTANKIGTYNVAVLAKYHKIPFYIAAPGSSFDLSIKTGRQILIEQRPREEIISGFGKLTAPKNVKVYNPAFDVTPYELIAAFITERGILRPPYKKTLRILK